jgi:hypothetical protein
MAYTMERTKLVLPYNFTPRDYQVPFLHAMESGKKKRAICVWHRRCLLEGTPIAMADGSFKKIEDIVKGEEVLSYTKTYNSGTQKTTYGLYPKKVKKLWFNGEADTYNFNGLYATENHIVLTRGTWKPIGHRQSLTNGGKLAFGTVHNPELAEVLGLLLTDGHITKNQTPKFTNIDERLLRRFEELVVIAFPEVKPKRYKKGKVFDIVCPTKIKTNCHPIRKYFKTSNIMPDIVWKFDEESTLAFLSGVISGDGSIYSRITITPRGFSCLCGQMVIEGGINPQLAEDYRLLLLKFGIRGKVKKDPRGNNTRLFIYSLSSLHNLSRIKIYSKKKQERFEYLLKNVKKHKTNFWEEKISDNSIKTNGSVAVFDDLIHGKVYDLEVEDFHSYIANGYIVHNSGKDKTFLNYMIPRMIERKGAYYYYFPTSVMGRDVLWDGMDRDGYKFTDHFPFQLIARKNEAEMKIELKNGSIFKIRGTDRNEPIGVNPVGCVFSEFSCQNPKAGWDLARPILAENGGWAVFNFTPRGKNHAYRLFRMAEGNPDWFCEKLTVDDTNAIDLSAIDDDRKSGMSEEMIQQEYYCSFEIGQEGSYYGRIVENLWEKGQITNVPYDNQNLVHTAWDLGYGDDTAIIFYQLSRFEKRIIDYYENHGEGMSHYIRILADRVKSEKYIYGDHFAPHDISHGNMGTGETLFETARKLGLQFRKVPREKRVDDGIERTRQMLPTCWIDKEKCSGLIDCLENYHRQFHDKSEVFGQKPVHDLWSHGADAIRTMSKAIQMDSSGGMSKDQYKALKAQYGYN